MMTTIQPPRDFAPSRQPHLDSDSNRQLALAYHHDGDIEARNEMIEGNQRLVTKQAMKYRQAHVPIEDLISVGNLGLIHAIEKYDPALGTAFSTYAVRWICYRMEHYLMREAYGVQVPESLMKQSRQLIRAERDLTQKIGNEPEPDQLASVLGWDVAHVVAVKHLDQMTCPDWDDIRGQRLTDLMPDDSDLFEQAAGEEIIAQLSEAMNVGLSERDRDIVARFYGLNDREPETHQAIANDYNLTARQVRSIIKRSLERLETSLDG